MKTFLLIGILLTSAFTSIAKAQVDHQQTLDSGVVLTGQTVIMGTWMWDIELNSQARSPNADVWWQQANDVDQYLVPVCNSRMALLSDIDYDSLTASDLRRVRFSRARILNDHIVPGAILALRTNEGNLAKIRVIGYRQMHDMSFDDARFAWPGWSSYLVSRPNKLNYHLEIEWSLYSGRNTDL